MNRTDKDMLIQQIRRKALQDERNRQDPRFTGTMGFLVAKGFLKSNIDFVRLPNKRLRIADAIWAGLNVEPRILEVLPAAVLRLPRHFDFDPAEHADLARVVGQLRRREAEGDGFHGIPYAKIRVWAELPLRDKRVKPVTKKKKVKTFRLDPLAVERLTKAAQQRQCTETEVIESLLSGLAE